MSSHLAQPLADRSRPRDQRAGPARHLVGAPWRLSRLWTFAVCCLVPGCPAVSLSIDSRTRRPSGRVGERSLVGTKALRARGRRWYNLIRGYLVSIKAPSRLAGMAGRETNPCRRAWHFSCGRISPAGLADRARPLTPATVGGLLSRKMHGSMRAFCLDATIPQDSGRIVFV